RPKGSLSRVRQQPDRKKPPRRRSGGNHEDCPQAPVAQAEGELEPACRAHARPQPPDRALRRSRRRARRRAPGPAPPHTELARRSCRRREPPPATPAVDQSPVSASVPGVRIVVGLLGALL